MSFESYVAKRLVKSKPYKNTVSSPIIKISILSIVIGIVMMIISISSSVGLQKTIESKVSSFFGHISISNFENNSSFSSLNPFVNDFDYNLLQSNDKIKYFQKVAYKSGLIIKSNNFEGVVLKGVTSKFNWEDFSKYITSGRVISLNSNISNEVIISEILSNKLLINLGDKFKATFFKSNSLSIPNERIFKVVGIYNSGLIEFDQLYFFGDIRHIQKMNKWNSNQIGNFEIFISNYNDLDRLGNEVYAETPSTLDAMTVKQKYATIFEWIPIFTTNIYGIIGC